MNLKRQRDGNSERIGQIVLMLLALAVLAECANCRPLHVRLCVFRILRRAEYAAVALFIDRFDAFSAEALRNAKLPDDGQTPYDSLFRLAFRLRTMAALLAATQLSSMVATRQVSSAVIDAGHHPYCPCALPDPDKHDTS